MASNEYRFLTEWLVPGRVENVSNILEDIERFPIWCPAVYLRVEIEDPGDDAGVGKRVRVLSKGKLPYRLRWAFTVTENNKPCGFAIRAEGDFDGTGIWALEQRGAEVYVRYDWRIRANKPLIRTLSPLLKPVFRGNHLWAMKQTEIGLRGELSYNGNPSLTSPSLRQDATR